MTTQPSPTPVIRQMAETLRPQEAISLMLDMVAIGVHTLGPSVSPNRIRTLLADYLGCELPPEVWGSMVTLLLLEGTIVQDPNTMKLSCSCHA